MYVSIKGSVVEVFDAAHKAAALKLLCGSIRDAVDFNKSCSTKTTEKVAIVLTASVSVSADDKVRPTSLKATVGIDGVLTAGTAQAFKASGNSTMSGLNLKKLDRDIAELISSVVADLMRNRVIPQMLKMAP